MEQELKIKKEVLNMSYKVLRIIQIVDCVLAVFWVAFMTCNVVALDVDMAVLGTIMAILHIFHIEWCEKKNRRNH